MLSKMEKKDGQWVNGIMAVRCNDKSMHSPQPVWSDKGT